MNGRISVEELRSFVSLDLKTGEMRWKPRSDPAWNAKYAGKLAFNTIGTNGYRASSINGKTYYGHRVVHALVNGRWPDGDIDHIDRDRSNNSPSNLREANRSDNLKNTSSRGGTSKFLGVSWDSARRRWVAAIRVSGKRVSLGRFDCEVEAARAYDNAARKHYREFANPNFPEGGVAQ